MKLLITAILLFLASCASTWAPPRPYAPVLGYENDCEEVARGVIGVTEYGQIGTRVWADTVDVVYRCGNRYEVWKGPGFPVPYHIPTFHIEPIDSAGAGDE